MKKWIALLCLMLIPVLCACGSAEPADPPPVTETTAPLATEAPLPTIATAHYTLTVPAQWLDEYEYEIQEENTDTLLYTLVIREFRGYLDFGGGKLCTLALVPEGSTYTPEDPYAQLGQLETPEHGLCRLLYIRPTGLQYDENNEERYLMMLDSLPLLLDSLQPRKDCSYTPGSAETEG